MLHLAHQDSSTTLCLPTWKLFSVWSSKSELGKESPFSPGVMAAVTLKSWLMAQDGEDRVSSAESSSCWGFLSPGDRMLSPFLLVTRNSPSLLLSHTHPGGESLRNYCTLPSKWNRKNTPETSGVVFLVFLEGNLKPAQTPARRLLLLANELFSS